MNIQFVASQSGFIFTQEVDHLLYSSSSFFSYPRPNLLRHPSIRSQSVSTIYHQNTNVLPIILILEESGCNTIQSLVSENDEGVGVSGVVDCLVVKVYEEAVAQLVADIPASMKAVSLFMKQLQSVVDGMGVRGMLVRMKSTHPPLLLSTITFLSIFISELISLNISAFPLILVVKMLQQIFESLKIKK